MVVVVMPVAVGMSMRTATWYSDVVLAWEKKEG